MNRLIKELESKVLSKALRKQLLAAGNKAHRDGVSSSECPYLLEELERHYWLCGWWKAEYDKLGAK